MTPNSKPVWVCRRCGRPEADPDDHDQPCERCGGTLFVPSGQARKEPVER